MSKLDYLKKNYNLIELPLGEENARRRAEEIFGTDSVIQVSFRGGTGFMDYEQTSGTVGETGFDPAEDYLGKRGVEINHPFIFSLSPLSSL